MGEWPSVPLESLAADERSAISKPYGSAIFKSDYREQGVPVVRGVNLAKGIFHDADFVFIDDQLAERMPGAVMEPGDLVVTHRGTVGQVSMIPRSSRFPRYVASTSHVKIRLNPAKAVPEFYYYWFAGPQGQHSILSNVSTVGVPGLVQPVATVKKLDVPWPTPSEQRAVAEVLGALDDKIASNDRLNQVADHLASALLWANLDGGEVSIEAEAVVTMGASPPGESYNEVATGVPFYQGVRDFGFRSPRRRVWTTQPARLAAEGDTLISVRAPVGRTNIANEELCVGRGLGGLRSRKNRPMTLFHQVRAAHAAWAPYEAEGTVFGSINKDQLAAVRVPSVCAAGSAKLEEQLAGLERRIAAAMSESDALACTRDELLPLLTSGKLRVKDAEAVVSEVL